jgi:hypothetical protein
MRVTVSSVWRLVALLGALAAVVLGACRDAPRPATSGAPSAPPAAAVEQVPDAGAEVTIVIARSLAGTVDEQLIREAYRRVVAQGERDFGLRPERTLTIYVDPDGAIGLEGASGLSQKNAIHLRAGPSRSMATLLPLLMHEYTHALQHQVGRLRPQWWIEGQAEHQALRVRDPASAERERRALYTRLAADVRARRAPALTDLRGGLGWDEYVKRAGAGKAYGWGNAAVAFIESRAGFEGVVRVMTDRTGENTLRRFDELVAEVTGLGPEAFDAALKQWVIQQARG